MKAYKLTKEGEKAAEANHVVMTSYEGTSWRISISADMSDTQAAILYGKNHPYITKVSTKKE